MAWYEMKSAGLPSGLQNNMDSVLNKKFGTSTTYAPATWPDNVNLLGPLPEKTVSGAVASFSDGADDVPIKSASFGIVASGGGGTPSTPIPIVGKSSVTVYQTGKNFIDFVSNVNTGTSVGMTFSATADGGISYSGTATGTFGYATDKFDVAIKSGQTFTFSRNTAFNYIHRIRLVFSDDTTANVSIYANNTSVTYTPEKDVKAVRLLLAGLTVDTYYNDTVYIQTEYGSTPTAFQKYKSKTPITVSLGQTVYGGTLAEDGTLTITHTLYTFKGTETAVYKSNTYAGSFYIRFDYLPNEGDGDAPFLCSRAVYVDSFDNYAYGKCAGGTYCNVWLSNTDWANHQEVRNYLKSLYDNGEPLTIAYKLATPIVITGLDEISINTYLGDNNIWCDSGDTEVTYRADIALALAALQGNRSLGLMTARPDPEEPEEDPEEPEER